MEFWLILWEDNLSCVTVIFHFKFHEMVFLCPDAVLIVVLVDHAVAHACILPLEVQPFSGIATIQPHHAHSAKALIFQSFIEQSIREGQREEPEEVGIGSLAIISLAIDKGWAI